MGIWTVIKGAWNATGKLTGLLRLARELQKDADARIAIGLERMLSNLDERLRSAASDEERAEIVAQRRQVLISQFEYEQKRIARLGPMIMKEWGPPGAVTSDAPPLPEPERRALSAAATAAALQPARSFYDYLLAGNAFYAAQDFENALREYNAALKLRPDDPDVLNNRGTTLDELKRY
ncbi:MAG: tetratricopeptide repeat protein [Dehalococcoidia bacterium]|nr:tetratricopeptide repeat protein [Dehalococcoidia bacterium]